MTVLWALGAVWLGLALLPPVAEFIGFLLEPGASISEVARCRRESRARLVAALKYRHEYELYSDLLTRAERRAVESRLVD